MNRLSLWGPLTFFASATAVLATGCRTELPVAFEENLVHAKKWEIQTGVPMDQAVADTQWALAELFGTPDAPKWPAVLAESDDYAELVSTEHLQAASGSPDEAGRGLFRQHCVRCHGITGNGRGETAALVDPYPRDFRPGIFKFKSTSRGSKPLKADLARVIKHGIPGTSMIPDYQLSATEVGPLPDEAVAALVDYVIYLSVRGELERTLYDDAALELDLEGGDRLVDPALAQSESEEFTEQWELIEGSVEDIAGSWLDAEDDVVEVDVPDDMPLPRTYAELQQILGGDQAAELQASIERGKEVFVGTVSSCSKCHGPEGRGDGQEADYDDWTKDWTIRAGIEPDDKAALIPLMARGALPPRTIKPRNFQEGVFRGGSEPEDLYRRIMLGIAGTPMPAATLVPEQFEERDVWHLINYIRSLETPEAASIDAPAGEPQPAAAEGVPVASR